ncbi:MAG TPA: hypothetical protein PKY23_10955 [Bacillota bacterium]|nr:hypothetical protein [Bacillota bacterium]
MVFEWDQHPQASELDGFKLYQSKTSMGYPTAPVAIFTGGATTTGTIAAPQSPGRYFFVLTAFTGDVESDYSNEVSFVVKPNPPKLKSIKQVAEIIKNSISKLAGLFGEKKTLRYKYFTREM